MPVVVDIPDHGRLTAGFVKAANMAVNRAGATFMALIQSSMQRTGGVAGAGKGVVNNVPSTPGTPPAVQTGRLRNSVVSEPGGNLRARVGTNVAYGKHLEFGANPRPVKGRLLAIPLHRKARLAYLSAGGSTRKAAAANGLFRIKSKNGTFLLVKSRGKGKGVEPWYALVASATIRARPWLIPGMYSKANQAQATAVFSRVFRAEMVKAVRAASTKGAGGAQ